MEFADNLVVARPLQEDFGRFLEIYSDPQTNLFNPKGPMNANIARIVFSHLLDHWKEKGFGVWKITEKNNPSYIIGFGGLSYRLYVDEIKLNLGYRLDKSFWGKGYATALSLRAIHYGLKELKLKEIFALVRPNHVASIKVLEKSGMRLAGELADVENDRNSLVYQIES